MPFQVLKSQADKVVADFPAEVEKYRQAMLDHRFAVPAQQHVPAVAAVPATPDIPPIPSRGPLPGRPAIKGSPPRPGKPAIQAHPGVPRPTSHPLIEACIRRVQVKDKPDDFVADYEVIDDSPTLRERKDALIAEVINKENELAIKVWPVGKRRLDGMKQAQIMSKGEASHTDEEKQFLADLTVKQNKLNSIQLEAATLTSEIEDLTDQTIGWWSGKLTE